MDRRTFLASTVVGGANVSVAAGAFEPKGLERVELAIRELAAAVQAADLEGVPIRSASCLAYVDVDGEREVVGGIHTRGGSATFRTTNGDMVRKVFRNYENK